MMVREKRHCLGSEKGMVLAVTLMMITILILLGTTAVMSITTDLKIGSNCRESAKALYHAEAGTEFVIDYLRNNVIAYPAANGSSVTFSVVPPPGFTFSSSVVLTCIDSTSRKYRFQITGTASANAEKTVEVVFRRSSILPQGADGAVAMYGSGSTVALKSGGGGGSNLDGTNYPLPGNANCNGNACRTSGNAAGSVPGLYTPFVAATVSGDTGHLAGTPSQRVGGGSHTEATWQNFVNDILNDPSSYQTGTYGTRANPAVTVVASGTTLNGSANGAGIVIVQNGGTFHMGGNSCFEGLVILVGNGTLTATGTAIVYGSVITISHTSKTVDANGTTDLYYSSQALANLDNIGQLYRFQRLSWRDVN